MKKKGYVIIAIAMLHFYTNAQLSVEGIVLDAQTKQAIPYCSVVLNNESLGCITDLKGQFSLAIPQVNEVRITIRCLSYQSMDTLIKIPTAPIIIKLPRQTLALPDINVIAKTNAQISSSSLIDQTALQHIQPSSLTEVLQLLPGGLTQDPNMSSPNKISLRQVGSDNNTSMGVNIIIDKIPQNNDGNLQRSFHSDNDISDNNTVGIGHDLRQISTDDIEKVEVITGIPSAKYGDLTSGAIIITPKSGLTQWVGRFKTDIKNKLFSLNKGLQISDRGGYINLGLDYLDYTSDPRNPLNNYQRITSSLRYKKQFKIYGKNLITKLNLRYIKTIDSEKSDPELNNGKEDYYTADYQKINASFNADYYIQSKVIDKLSFDVSYAITRDVLERSKFISVNGPLPQPISVNEGVHKAVYLPSQYQAYIKIDGKPQDIYANLNLDKAFKLSSTHHKLLIGTNVSSVKNSGQGEIYDVTRPLSSSTKSSRPRNFNDIPALTKFFVFIEDDISFKLGNYSFNTKIGLRSSQLLGIDAAYTLSNKVYLDPRINARINLPAIKSGQSNVQLWLGFGYGVHTKLPITYHLYPHDVYSDIIELNYFSQNPDLRTIYTRTFIDKPVNHLLEASRNEKKELSLGVNWNGFNLNTTLFHEYMDTGFTSERVYRSLTYNRYNPSSLSSEGLTAPPTLNQFDYNAKKTFDGITNYTNGSIVDKKGIEYSMSFPKINTLYTQISLIGAWFKTYYSSKVIDTDHPNVVLFNEEYPYVGYYGATNYKKEQFNTNFRFDTHIPLLRMIFTLDTQAVWYYNRKIEWQSEYPLYYMDSDEIIHDYKVTDADDPSLRHLMLSFNDHYFDNDPIPLSLDMHIKMTKEIGEHLRVAFYVNRLLSYYQSYTDKYGRQLERKSNTIGGPSSLYFGAELKLRI
ncbi:TonB-dependent receptor [Carboxylicivirga sp. N1Y90]|uniref:TonB-dependent receptor n=1 Tax=Carboxylicivirga fragile TaxID=3417571 RepID=UPI003D33A977|nr:TonB-dependent receptor plug domain-containing protein [Marinilabiliaceae bacterium N1Y90]